MKFHSLVRILFVFSLGVCLMGCEEGADKDVTEESNTEENIIVEKAEETNNEDSGGEEENNTNEVDNSEKECHEIEDMIARGDCYEAFFVDRFWWQIDEGFDDIYYFPVQHNSDNWKHVFYFEIDENNQLSEVQKTDHYDTYLENYNQRKIDEGMERTKFLWEKFTSVFPKKFRKQLKRIAWTDSGEDRFYAVGRVEESPEDTILYFSHHLGEYQDGQLGILIHEFGHILTLNEEQLKIDEAAISRDPEAMEVAKVECPTFYRYGCVEESSYIYAFYQRFWEDIIEEHEAISWETEDDYKEFYLKYQDRFFNTYQGTNIGEDIAESFNNFIMSNSEDVFNQTEMKYEKIQFFYEYDELIELRAKILENISKLPIVEPEF